MPMPPVAVADGNPTGHVQGREQGSDSVPLVIMRLARRHAGRQGENRLGAIQGLVAVGTTIADRPPHGSPRAAFPHGALILDAWRQSELRGKDERHAAAGAIDQSGFAFVSTAGDVAGSDGSKWSARAG